MSHPAIGRLQGRLRRRWIAQFALSTLPLLIALFALVSRIATAQVAIAFAGIAAVILVVFASRHLRAITPGMIVRRLDAGTVTLEDSADLLLRTPDDLDGLAHLQRERVAARLDLAALPELRDPWPWRRILIGVLLAIATAVIPLPTKNPPATQPPATVATGADANKIEQTTLVSARLDIKAPGYTGLPERVEAVLDTQLAEGSVARWQLRLDPPPGAVSLRFLDGSLLALKEDAGTWQGERRIDASMLYRLEVEGAAPLADDRLHRLDVIVDLAPEIRVNAPDKTLSVLDSDQKSWSLDFEVSDDYGVVDAQLAMTLAQGSGEQVTVSERSLRLQADAGGDPRQRRYRRRLDLAELGFVAGDDLIVRLLVHDNRRPAANLSRSPSYILRWPADNAVASEGVDGIVQKVLPAYFRSQRQIIIDTEALIAERPLPAAEKFLARSDSIGVDQKILRLRYGQFLGEEFESGDRGKPPAKQDKGEHDEHASQQDALTSEHDHEVAGGGAPVFGSATDVLSEYGHTHDHAEAATLLDPETRKILKAALAEMWQAELHLRQADPTAALPYENRALLLIKQVQQSTRIYLARVGLELPPVDESRRLSGERKDLRDPRGPLRAASLEHAPIGEFYQALLAGAPADLGSFETWLRAHDKNIPDALGVLAAIDVLRRDPDCAGCRERLLDVLWPLVPTPPAAVRMRARPDEIGRHYLDALGKEGRP